MQPSGDSRSSAFSGHWVLAGAPMIEVRRPSRYLEGLYHTGSPKSPCQPNSSTSTSARCCSISACERMCRQIGRRGRPGARRGRGGHLRRRPAAAIRSGRITSRPVLRAILPADRHAGPISTPWPAAGNDIFTLNASILPVVGQLAEAGYRLGILSNTCEGHWEHCLRPLPLLAEDFSVYALELPHRALQAGARRSSAPRPSWPAAGRRRSSTSTTWPATWRRPGGRLRRGAVHLDPGVGGRAAVERGSSSITDASCPRPLPQNTYRLTMFSSISCRPLSLGATSPLPSMYFSSEAKSCLPASISRADARVPRAVAVLDASAPTRRRPGSRRRSSSPLAKASMPPMWA